MGALFFRALAPQSQRIPDTWCVLERVHLLPTRRRDGPRPTRRPTRIFARPVVRGRPAAPRKPPRDGSAGKGLYDHGGAVGEDLGDSL